MKVDVQQIKQRFGIIGNNPGLNRAIDVALQVAPTDLSVLITGESGVGKETFPQIIHQNSQRKHGQYIAVNCGAIDIRRIRPSLVGIGHHGYEIILHRPDLRQDAVHHHLKVRTAGSENINQHDSIQRPDRMVGNGNKSPFRQMI